MAVTFCNSDFMLEHVVCNFLLVIYCTVAAAVIAQLTFIACFHLRLRSSR